MSNLSPTAKKIVSVNAREHKVRAELAELVAEKYKLVVELNDVEGMSFQRISALLGIKSRQQTHAMYKTEKDRM